MKKIKKIFALLMTVAMVMGLSVTAFAAETTNVTITVDNGEGAAVKYLQIVEPDTTSTLGWKYVEEYAADFNGVTVENLIEIAKSETSENQFSTSDAINNTDAYRSSDLAEKLEGFKNKVLEHGTPISENTFTVTKGGLYVLIPQKADYTYSPTLVYVPVNSDTSITVDVKGAPNKPEKELVNIKDITLEGATVDNDKTVTANDKVEYKVTITYPYFSDGAENQTFKVTDSLENGTYFVDSNNNLKVQIDGIDYNKYTLKDSEGTVIESIGGETSFVLDFVYDSAQAGKEVVITYTVDVDDDISNDNLLKNTVKSTIGTVENQKIIISDTVKVEFNKVDAENNNTKLDGAIFALYEGTAGDDTEDTLIALYADLPNLDNVKLPAGYEQFRNKLVLNDTTLDVGEFSINNLDANKSYYIKEIVAPDGYQVVDTEYQLIPGGVADGYPILNQPSVENRVPTVTDKYQYNDFTVKMSDESDDGIITNTKLSALPSTGGIGTTIFTIGGCAIMIAAAALFFAGRRKEKSN